MEAAMATKDALNARKMRREMARQPFAVHVCMANNIVKRHNAGK